LKKIKPKVNRLYALGNIELFQKRAIAIIGSRNYSEYGKKMTVKITKELVKKEYVIISGLANGIDAIAHETCINNFGNTIAVLGSGLNKIYPKENINLVKRIVENGGLILTEYPDNESVQKRNFPKRNRIISGLSDAVLVIEGSYRSGTSITANDAVTQGKKVFYVPNCYGNKNSYESIKLAKSGGIIATCGDDIFKSLENKTCDTYESEMNEKFNIIQKNIDALDSDSKRIFNCLLKNGAMNSGQISEMTKINIVEVNQILSVLELNDFIINNEISKFKVREEFCE